MLTRNLLSHSIPILHLNDSISDALQFMNDNHIVHLPVVDEGKFIGMVSEEDLLQENNLSDLTNFKGSLSLTSVNENEHFLKALKVAADNNLSIIPVTGENMEMLGVITFSDLLEKVSEFVNVHEPGAIIVLEMENKDFSFAAISRLIETNDAQITQLNTNTHPQSGIMQVTIKINKLEISDIIATFQRYEYNVKYYFGEEFYENEMRSNYDNLMNYLKI